MLGFGSKQFDEKFCWEVYSGCIQCLIAAKDCSNAYNVSFVPF